MILFDVRRYARNIEQDHEAARLVRLTGGYGEAGEASQDEATAFRGRGVAETGEPGDERGEVGRGFQPGQGGAEAEVRAAAEGQRGGAGPGEVEGVGLGEAPRVTVARADEAEHVDAVRDLNPADRE